MKFLRVLMTRNGKPLDFEKLSLSIERICKEFKLQLLYVFGSYAYNNANRLSDLDVAYLSESKLDLDRILKLISKLQEVFREEAIDIVDLKEAPLPLIHRIIKEGKCLYTKDFKIKLEFEMRHENLYFDTEPLRREYFKALTRRIKDGSFGYR